MVHAILFFYPIFLETDFDLSIDFHKILLVELQKRIK